MAKIYKLQGLEPTKLNSDEALWVYNGLDCCVTAKVWNELQPLRTPACDLSYNFVRAMQAPALEMMQRGLKVDTAMASKRLYDVEREAEKLTGLLNRLSCAVWGKDLNPQSPAQLVQFFYSAMGLPEQTRWDKKTKSKRVTADRNALEKLAKDFWQCRPIVATILAIRNAGKVASVLRSGIDADGRMRTSYNVAGTETGRWSSSKNCVGTGTNFQNITDRLRDIFVAEPGHKYAYVDQEQAESRLVAYLSGDEAYIHACESGDLHTSVAKMVWPDLNWPGDNAKEDRACADQIYYRHFSYRDLAKRGGHGTNYYGKPPTMAKHLAVDKELMEEFQIRYFKAFPGISRWHGEVARQLQLHGWIETPLGRVRHFFGRKSDDATLREAIAFVPQSVIGEGVNLGIWRVWKYLTHGLSPDDPRWAQVMAQLHDAGLFLFKEEHEATVIPEIKKLMTLRATVRGRSMVIPCSAETGWNWRHYDKVENVDGIKKWSGKDERQRAVDPDAPIFTRCLS